MLKITHEIRDPIHVFVRLDSDERKVLDSRPVQRLRHVHQLGLSYLVYPGATHKRFEHSLGVMELASRVFDVVTSQEAVRDEVRNLLPEIADDSKKRYWRRVLRMAALCHDVGHLPFSHAAEKELLPDGWDHERLTEELIVSDEMDTVWRSMTPPLRHEDVVRLATGRAKAGGGMTSPNWEAILSEIIVGDNFGVDRMDYLLRDSHHTGVAYGRFDHYRLIDTLRILPRPGTHDKAGAGEPVLGVEVGGLHSAEALLLARYFIYSQVYLHRVRRIYDIHLKDFLRSWLPAHAFSTSIQEHLQMTDNEVTASLLETALDSSKPGHESARRIVRREHFRVLYERNPDDIEKNPEAALAIFEAAAKRFGAGNVRYDRFGESVGTADFPVVSGDGRTVSSLSMSNVLVNLPVASADYVFVAPEKRDEAEKWLKHERDKVIQPRREDENEQAPKSGSVDGTC